MNTLRLPTIRTFLTHTDESNLETLNKFLNLIGNPELKGDFRFVAAYLAGEAKELGLNNLVSWFDAWAEHVRDRLSHADSSNTRVVWF